MNKNFYPRILANRILRSFSYIFWGELRTRQFDVKIPQVSANNFFGAASFHSILPAQTIGTLCINTQFLISKEQKQKQVHTWVSVD